MIRAWLQLLRIGAVFTAVADAWMAQIVAAGHLVTMKTGIITLATIGLYLGGMVLNDWCDRELDARERPERPIPSGRIQPRTALVAAVALLVFGVLMAAACAAITETPWTFVAATLLAAAIVGYNTGLKSTPLGPLVMGLCRGLNIVMAMAATGIDIGTLPWLVPAGFATYIAGVTLLARNEANQPRRGTLWTAAAMMVAGIGIIGASWVQIKHAAESPLQLNGWILLLLAVTLSVGRRVTSAARDPAPATVQRAVGYSLLSLITIDATLALATGGPVWGCVVIALVVPALFVGRWIRMT